MKKKIRLIRNLLRRNQLITTIMENKINSKITEGRSGETFHEKIFQTIEFTSHSTDSK